MEHPQGLGLQSRPWEKANGYGTLEEKLLFGASEIAISLILGSVE